MADTAETPKPERKPAQIKRLSLDKPSFLVIYQTESRSNVEIVDGDPQAADYGAAAIMATARDRAASLKQPVFVFGPQRAAFGLPPKPEAQQLPLGFEDLLAPPPP